MAGWSFSAAVQGMPPNQVMVGLALLLTFFVMTPVARQVQRDALEPYTEGKLSESDALAAGIAVLFAAVQSTIDERRFESAMLRALGARRRTVFAGVMAEFAALGLAAGVLASAGASILAAVIAVQLFELPYSFNPLIWIAGVGAGILVVCVSGFFAARGAINAAPVDVLRGAPA